MIPTISTFETLLRREVSQHGKTFIRDSIKNDFYSCSLDSLSIFDSLSIKKTEETLELFTILYSLKVWKDGAYTITYIGSIKHDLLEEGYISADSILNTLLSLI